MSRTIVQIETATLGYPDVPILTAGPLQIVPGSRIGVLGVNGAGKTTLMRTLAGDLAPLNGEIVRGQHSAVGYFAQHQLDLLDPQQNALEHIRRREPKTTDQQYRNYLGGWGFASDMALRPTASLSGGEKARLVLALIAWQQPALLLLDEPTNHLDIEMRHALGVALQDYAGALVIVSHDRDLLSRCVDEFWVVRQGRVEMFGDDLRGYAERTRQTPTRPSIDGTARERRQSAAEQRRLSQPLRTALKKLEQRIDTLGTQRAELERTLADPVTYHSLSSAELQALLARRVALISDLESTEVDWLAAQQQLDALTAEPHSLRKT